MKTKIYFLRVIFIPIMISLLISTSCKEDEDESTKLEVIADFTITPASGNTSTEFVFDASSTETCGEWEEIEYEWEFGDGATNYNGDVTETHQYDTPGEYTVMLNVKIYRAGNTGSAGDIVEKTLMVTE